MPATKGRYRKKPVVIDAFKWEGHWASMLGWVHGLPPSPINPPRAMPPIYSDGDQLRIATLEGDMTADLGDWIIRGVKGEFYPCKPDIFEATYEPADASPEPERG